MIKLTRDYPAQFCVVLDFDVELDLIYNSQILFLIIQHYFYKIELKRIIGFRIQHVASIS